MWTPAIFNAVSSPIGPTAAFSCDDYRTSREVDRQIVPPDTEGAAGSIVVELLGAVSLGPARPLCATRSSVGRGALHRCDDHGREHCQRVRPRGPRPDARQRRAIDTETRSSWGSTIFSRAVTPLNFTEFAGHLAVSDKLAGVYVFPDFAVVSRTLRPTADFVGLFR